MIYLSGCINEKFIHPDIGWLITFGNQARQRHMSRLGPLITRSPWAIDNGCFKNPDIDIEAYISWIKSMPSRENCLFATAPDVVGNAALTLDRSLEALHLIRPLVPAAFVAQDGIERIFIPWTELDVLFIGGTDGFKQSSEVERISSEAIEQGKAVHVGRVNTKSRLLFSRHIRATSVDGTMLAFGPDKNLPILTRWMKEINHEPDHSFCFV